MTGRVVSARTRVAAVIGTPVAHSLSPALHNAAFAALGMDAVYLAFAVAPSDLAAAVAGFRAMGFLGVSVTVPHKQAIAPLCDRVVAPADAIGAVNCLVFSEGAVIGHNTDAGGFIDSLSRDAGVTPAGKRAVLLGAGGAARAVHAGLVAAGAAEVVIVTRRPGEVPWADARPWDAGELAALCRDCDLLVDCSSVALNAERDSGYPVPVPLSLLPDSAVVASLIYHRKPALLAEAEARHLQTLDGAGMLVYQGARAFSLWTGVAPPIDAMWEAMRRALAGH